MKSTWLFRNRVHAGQALGAALVRYADRNDVTVLGLPRGGVPVACEVARRLGAPLDVLIVRKLGTPGWEELAMGAIASGGVVVVNEEVVRSYGITRPQLEAAVKAQREELRRRERAFRGSEDGPVLEGRTVILVDDGIATGSTAHAAVDAVRAMNPGKIVFATPVASQDACSLLEPMVDDLVVLKVPADFESVGSWYEDFTQTTDDEVARLLGRSPRPPNI